MFEFMKRFMNYGSIFAFLGLLGLILPHIGFQIVPSDWQIIVDFIMAFFVSAGVINNPSSGIGYKD